MNDNQKILLYDLETSPIQAYSWGPKYDTNLIEVTTPMKILSYSAKWLGGRHITKGIIDYKGYKKGVVDDENIVKDLWKLMDEADVVVAQNGKSYDVKVLNARFIAHGLTPPSPYKVVDPKTEAKKYLRLHSYSLDDLCDYFGIGRKVHHEGFPLWLKCMSGDRSAWKRMLRYNRNDVVIMEQLYLLLKPWMVSHPPRFADTHELSCPKCGSNNIQARGYMTTRTMRYQRWCCTSCGSWSRSPKSEPSHKPLMSI